MKTFPISFFVVLCTFYIFQVSEAQIIHVPADYSSIQEGITAADPGDTVLVADGLYYENINYLGKKPLMVASEFLVDGDTNHINNTIINGSQPDDPNFGSVVTFSSGEDTTSVLCGFTITGGTGNIESSVNYRMGGGVNISFSGANLEYNHILNNTVTYDNGIYGGGVQAGGPIGEIPWVVMRYNRICNNTAVSMSNEGSGGGVEIYYNTIMAENELFNNTVNAPLRCSGGGLEIAGAFGTIEVDVRNNIIRNNKAISVSYFSEYSITGGLSMGFNLTGIVSGNDISFNEVESSDNIWGQGTGVLVQEAVTNEFVFENNFITNNTHTGLRCLGGGMLLYNTGGKFQNNIICDNHGTHGGGITIQDCTEAFPVLINNTITGNDAANQGGGLYIDNATAMVINTIIWGNTSPRDPSISTGENVIAVLYSDVQGDETWPGDGNMNDDPVFLEDGYHIDGSSPCLDSGDESIHIEENWYYAPLYDFEGDPRPAPFGGPDIGADEYFYVGHEELQVTGCRLHVYPNPADGISNIKFQISESKSVVLKVLDICGHEVVTLVNQVQAPGEQEVHFDVSGLPAGIYFIRMEAGDAVFTEKMVVMK
ncbi:MAG: T9SS type A sorting domain-containing protein [Bacteroidales bacterium]|nr:T9SS type A sorting domain-containing protein [Lentimicrobiaceae bacterium]MDD5695592.1 T9SS type A sorting domain-containing protein [Bacteroidales bacterium]